MFGDNDALNYLLLSLVLKGFSDEPYGCKTESFEYVD